MRGHASMPPLPRDEERGVAAMVMEVWCAVLWSIGGRVERGWVEGVEGVEAEAATHKQAHRHTHTHRHTHAP